MKLKVLGQRFDVVNRQQYFEMTFDDRDCNGWQLAADYLNQNGSWKDVWSFTRCERVPNSLGINFEISTPGVVQDFNIASFNIPIISQKLGNILSVIAQDSLQRIPISIETVEGSSWEILNVLHLVDCLDYENSHIDYYPRDPCDLSISLHPERAGKPRGIRKLRIKHASLRELHVFRISNWEIPIIVSEPAKTQIEAAQISGVRFLPV